VTTTLSPPIRILAVVGVLAAIGLGILFFASRSDSDSSAPAAPSVATSHASPTTQPASPAKPAVTPAKPKVVLEPGLPAPIAHALRNSKVVVVALYARGVNGDMKTVAEARAGAKSAHSGFAAVNVVNEAIARRLGKFAGTTTAPPAVLVVKRPGKIVNQFSGIADSEIVAQAALNAGAGR
jgi:hypothetical protein